MISSNKPIAPNGMPGKSFNNGVSIAIPPNFSASNTQALVDALYTLLSGLPAGTNGGMIMLRWLDAGLGLTVLTAFESSGILTAPQKVSFAGADPINFGQLMESYTTLGAGQVTATCAGLWTPPSTVAYVP